MDLASYLDFYENWPKPGIKFCDIWPLLNAADARKKLLYSVKQKWASSIDGAEEIYLGAIESRGFAVAGMLSNLPKNIFVPIRKAGKLPPFDVVSEDISLEYGTCTIEMFKSKSHGANMLLVDDVLATGGTLYGAKKLAEKAGYNVIGAVVLVNLLAVKKEHNWPSRQLYSLLEV